MKQPFVIERTYNAPAEKVWKAITEKDRMKQWYFHLEEFKPEVGFEFSFAGKGRNGEDYIHLCKITEVIEGKKLTYSWSYKDHPGMSYVTFELFADDDKTTVRLTHDGIETMAENGPDFSLASFTEGWTTIIGKKLKEFAEN